MQANWLTLFDFFDETRDFVLATIIATTGSTYQKNGAMMLINDQGEYAGLLSGGCLEADISLHALTVLKQQQSEVVRYDLSADEDLLWGMGLGCEGAIEILLQPLTTANDHLGFNRLVQALMLRRAGWYRQKITTDTPPQGEFNADIKVEHKSSENMPTANQVKVDENFIDVMVTPPLSLLVCGAGPDAIPLAKMAQELGWQITVWDHRGAHLQQFANLRHTSIRKIRPLDTRIEDYEGFDAVVLMTHNLNADGEYLQKAEQSTIEYIGLLGPLGRRNKLLDYAKLTMEPLSGRLFGPIGLDIGGRGPQAIALSICAQIQQQRYLCAKG